MQTGDERELARRGLADMRVLACLTAALLGTAVALAQPLAKIFAAGPCNGVQGSYVFWMTYAAEAAASARYRKML